MTLSWGMALRVGEAKVAPLPSNKEDKRTGRWVNTFCSAEPGHMVSI